MMLSSKGKLQLGESFNHADNDVGETTHRHYSVAVGKTLDHFHAEDNIIPLKFNVKGDLLQGVSAITVILLNKWDAYGEAVSIGSRRRAMCVRPREDRSKSECFVVRATRK